MRIRFVCLSLLTDTLTNFNLPFQDEEINLFNKRKAAAQAALAQAQQATAQVAKEQMKGKKKWNTRHA